MKPEMGAVYEVVLVAPEAHVADECEALSVRWTVGRAVIEAEAGTAASSARPSARVNERRIDMKTHNAAVLENLRTMDVPAITVTVDDDLQRGRWSVFFRLVLALPHLFLLAMLGGIVFLLAPIVWIVALVRGSVPESLHEFYARLVRYSVHVYGYLYLLSNRWPPFMGEQDYEVDVLVPEQPVKMNRWSIAFRLILSLPPLALAGALGSGSAGGSTSGFTYNAGALLIVGIFGWWVAMVRGRMAPGMRDLGVYSLQYAAQAYAYLFLLTPKFPDADPALAEAGPLPDHPVRIEPYEDDLRRNRLLVFFRGLIAIPHLIWLVLWAVVAYLTAFLGWWITLFTGRMPHGLRNLIAYSLRYQAQTVSYALLLTDRYPYSGPGRCDRPA